MTKGIVFDFGGVLSFNPSHEEFDVIAAECGITYDQLKEGFRLFRLNFDADIITGVEMYLKIFAHCGVPADAALAAKVAEDDNRLWIRPNPVTLELMRELKSAGHRIGILTNMCIDFELRYFRPLFADYIALADAMVVSGREHIVKPNPQIYELMASRMNLPPANLTFIDDRIQNVEGARKLGWQGIICDTIEEVRTQLYS